MTKFEKMKQMNDEELGKFFRKIFHITIISSEELARAIYYAGNCQGCPLRDSCEQTLGCCQDMLKTWFNSEVAE